MDNTYQVPTVLSFCSGYGGIEGGLALAGVEHEILAYVEGEAFCIANLVSKMEENTLGAAPVWSDVKTFNPHVFRGAVDILIAGYPCQPFSAAGRRAGEDDPRHLWPHIRKHIQVIKPRRVFIENVEGHISLGLATVLSDLEADGYRTAWAIFSAYEIGSPQRRKRLFIMADADGGQREWQRPRAEKRDAAVGGEEQRRGAVEHPQHDGPSNAEKRGSVSSTGDGGAQRQNTAGDTARASAPEGAGDLQASEELADTDGTRCEGQEWEGATGAQGQPVRHPAECSGRWPAGVGEHQHEWEEPRVIRKLEPRVGGAVDGVGTELDADSNRVDRIRMLGNGVVRQTAALAWVTLDEDLRQ